jgi:hypothetical protein
VKRSYSVSPRRDWSFAALRGLEAWARECTVTLPLQISATASVRPDGSVTIALEQSLE